MTWQSIATAPRDGRPVWAKGDNYGDPAKGQHCCWVWWDGQRWLSAAASEDQSVDMGYLRSWLPSATEASPGVSPPTDRVLRLAAIIREVDGNHALGAVDLAEAILGHPRFGECGLTEEALEAHLDPLVSRLIRCANDPMWADHAEVPKAWLNEAVAALKSQTVGKGLYIQPVPDHCDRIRWRGRIYDLPFTPRPELQPKLGALADLVRSHGLGDCAEPDKVLGAIREALRLYGGAGQPVSVGERPWEREGWCDEAGRCWFASTGRTWYLGDHRPVAERLTLLGDSEFRWSLPARAMPVPAELE